MGAENVIHALLPAVVDKPGCGASTGDWTRLTLHDRAAETLAAVADQPEIDANRIALLGGSQGAIRSPSASYAAPASPTAARRTESRRPTRSVPPTLSYAGVGWHTTGDALLANTAAAMARARQQAAREELAHELGSTVAVGALPAAA
ncbi:MAG TPA: hypothetical protein VGJ53_07680 [Micromonosporaceae bacterium]